MMENFSLKLHINSINLNNLYLLLYIYIKKRESRIPSPLFYCSLIKANNCSAALRGPECS